MRYAFYFEFDSTDDPYDWSWGGLLADINDDSTQIDWGSMRLKEMQ